MSGAHRPSFATPFKHSDQGSTCVEAKSGRVLPHQGLGSWTPLKAENLRSSDLLFNLLFMYVLRLYKPNASSFGTWVLCQKPNKVQMMKMMESIMHVHILCCLHALSWTNTPSPAGRGFELQLIYWEKKSSHLNCINHSETNNGYMPLVSAALTYHSHKFVCPSFLIFPHILFIWPADSSGNRRNNHNKTEQNRRLHG